MLRLRNQYSFLTTIEHGYFLATPEELHAVLPVDPETLIPRMSQYLDRHQLPVTDLAGNQWILLEEDCQYPEFIELLADTANVFPHQIRERIKHHETNLSFNQFIAFIKNTDLLIENES